MSNHNHNMNRNGQQNMRKAMENGSELARLTMKDVDAINHNFDKIFKRHDMLVDACDKAYNDLHQRIEEIGQKHNKLVDIVNRHRGWAWLIGGTALLIGCVALDDHAQKQKRLEAERRETQEELAELYERISMLECEHHCKKEESDG